MNKEVTDIVRERYASGAGACESNLCCAVDYDPKYLEIIPQEVIERDYGCGDPSRFVCEGETVLDLGSGTGKICFIASQLVGPAGRVIGVDMTSEMLAVARGAAPVVAERVGYGNVEFRRGKIQDLRTDLDALDEWLAGHPVANAAGYEALQAHLAGQGRDRPLIADDSVDLVVSNCVLNLVSDGEKRQLFEEIYRVLKRGGRIAIADIVSDEPSPEHLKADPTLWSGCVSGAMTEHGFVEMLEQVGFHGITIETYEAEPWQVVEGIEYRSVTLVAWKGKEGPCIEKNQAVIYRGPWKKVEDDDGHVYHRGQRMAVCEKTFDILRGGPYLEDIIPVEPALPVSDTRDFDCSRPSLRDPQETKSGLPKMTTEPKSNCC